MDLVDTNEAHSADKMTPWAIKSMQELGSEFSVSVGTVCTDNAKNNLRRNLRDEQLNQIKTHADEVALLPAGTERAAKEIALKTLREALLVDAFGCTSHLLNLVSQDLTNPSVIGPILEVAKYYRSGL